MEESQILKDLMVAEIQQGHDPARVYISNHVTFSDSTVFDFPNSPTAMEYKNAFQMFSTARSILCRYSKSKVETDIDCDFLEPAFHGYAKAEMCENHLFDTNKPPDNTYDLICQYLKQRPDDILAEHFKIMLEHKRNELSKFDCLKRSIRTKEIFAAKVSRASDSEIKGQIIATLYNRLGSLHTITKQKIRAIDSFQKSYDTDNSYYDSMFGLAWCYHYVHPEKSLKLFYEYLDVAPECAKKYFDAYYILVDIYVSFYGNIIKAKECYRKGLHAEDKQLPFLIREDTSSKRFAKRLMEQYQ